ncbi:hypothetical protein CLF_106133 [Clonorchis sinensis]|uniref:Uncharacterized protein n=1 Tax=Clonorchis sinensis TaxID=79923 RepID=G7YPP4_CLOSI|nr:hypothetical protein CLF_106133 [Clonorchis sinensis]
MTLRVQFRKSDLNDSFVVGDMCATFDELSVTMYYAFSRALLYCTTLEVYSNSSFSMGGRIAVYIQQTHVRSSTLDTWNAHIRDFLIPYLNSKINFAGAEDFSFIVVENVELRATEVLSIGGSVDGGEMERAALNQAVQTQGFDQISGQKRACEREDFNAEYLKAFYISRDPLRQTFTKADYAPFLIGFSTLSRGVLGSWGKMEFFADYANMVGVDVDLCSPIMLDRLTAKLNMHMRAGSNEGMRKPVTVTRLRPHMFPFTICDVEKVEMVSIVFELDCPVNTEPGSQVKIKSIVEQVYVIRSSFSCVIENAKYNLSQKFNSAQHFPTVLCTTVLQVRNALVDLPVRQIRFQQDHSTDSDKPIVVYMDPEKFLNSSKSYGQSDQSDNTFEDFLNERLAVIAPSQANPIACTQERTYLQAHGICPKEAYIGAAVDVTHIRRLSVPKTLSSENRSFTSVSAHNHKRDEHDGHQGLTWQWVMGEVNQRAGSVGGRDRLRPPSEQQRRVWNRTNERREG